MPICIGDTPYIRFLTYIHNLKGLNTAILIKIDNSKGIRISQPIINQANLENRDEEHLLLDKIKTVDKSKLVKRIGKLDEDKTKEIVEVLVKMFSY
ncbi:type II toxin-antitoxin system PemK/MazF family toxin [Thermodesulfatator atlanticus]